MRPKIPSQTARSLRQQAGFGCCRCGLPILQYHHIIPYSQEAHYRIEDMMVLCPLCHDMATKGALSLDKQRYIQQNPYNVSTGYTKGCLFVESKVCIIQSGGVLIVNNGPILVIDNHTLLKININENNQVELSIDLFDKKDRLVAKIVRNEWVAGNANLWDIRADHQKLKIQKKTGRIDLEINVQNSEIRIKANLWYKKHCIKLSSTGVEINGRVETRFKNLGFVNCRFEIDTFNKVVMIKPKTGESWNLISQNSLESLKTECINIWNEKYSNARNS